ncbi:MAG: site-specific DNA-methyltransferase [Ktedonobacteraceae bacterium]
MLYAGQETEWRNRLIWGDKKYVLPGLLPEFAGKVNLIYIDPPFATGADFSFTTAIPESEESLTKEPSMIEQKAYRDTWGRGFDGYTQWFYETVVLLRELLAENGSIYIHCDWRVDSTIRLILDEVFGSQYYGNEIIWHYQSGGRQENRYSKKHDTIFLYNRSNSWIFNADRIGEARGTAKRNNMKREVDEEGRIFFSIKSAGKIYKYYEDEKLTPPDVWIDISHIQQKDPQRVGYPTQKPEALLERIITASSNEGDLVLDCFCGSGTTAAVAEKLGRRWITCDLGRFAIHTARKRLLSIDDVKPFVVQNLGKYERQAWQTAEFADPTQRASVQLRYRNFILDLYHATPIDGYSWLHGVKGGKLIHVGSVDAPISLGEVRSIVNEFWRVKGKDAGEHTNGIDVLGWDFAFDLNETAKQMAADSNITLSFKKIPREVLEKKAVEQGDIAFYELAALAVTVQTGKRSVSVELQNFFMPPDDVPQDVKNAITHWRQWIDYWAIDWDYREDTFHNQWQSYRTKKQPDMLLKAHYEYEEPGTYIIVIKVIDILGNDTTKAVAVEIM